MSEFALTFLLWQLFMHFMLDVCFNNFNYYIFTLKIYCAILANTCLLIVRYRRSDVFRPFLVTHRFSLATNTKIISINIFMTCSVIVICGSRQHTHLMIIILLNRWWVFNVLHQSLLQIFTIRFFLFCAFFYSYR